METGELIRGVFAPLGQLIKSLDPVAKLNALISEAEQMGKPIEQKFIEENLRRNLEPTKVILRQDVPLMLEENLFVRKTSDGKIEILEIVK